MGWIHWSWVGEWSDQLTERRALSGQPSSKCSHRRPSVAGKGIARCGPERFHPSTWDEDFSNWQPSLRSDNSRLLLVKDCYCCPWIVFGWMCLPLGGVIFFAGSPWTESQCQRCLPGGQTVIIVRGILEEGQWPSGTCRGKQTCLAFYKTFR